MIRALLFLLLAVQAAVPELRFEADAEVLKPPLDVYLGEVGGVAANSRGQIFVYTRTGHPYATLGDNRTFARNGSRLFEFDRSGKFVREIGQDVYGFNAAIGLRVDPSDNVWTIDAAASQVIKFDPSGRVALVLGRKPEAIGVRPAQPAGGGAGSGAGGAGAGGGSGRGGATPGTGTPGSSFSRPADVAWDREGNIYVADGLGNNNRIAKFDRDGRFLAHWGSTGAGPGQFSGVKALAIDAQGNIYAADTGNKRVQVFAPDGAFKSQFGNVGKPLAMCITPGTPGSPQYLFISHAGDEDGMEDAAIYKVRLDGTIVGKFGTAGNRPGEFGLANSLDCHSEHELLVGELTNWRVQRVLLKR